MKKFGLIGYPLTHSFSPRYFAEKFEREGIENSEYRLYEIPDIEDVKPLLSGSIAGLNVTIPYKEVIMPFIDELDDDAAEIGAINTIKIVKECTKGYNTDIYGFEHALIELIGDAKPKAALILGTGGAAKAVKFVLNKMGIDYMTVSRNNGDLIYNDLDKSIIENHKLIINTTPLGTYPNIKSKPNIPYANLTPDHFLFDLTYNPSVTAFMSEGLSNGAKTLNGLRMLELQAEKSWEIWNQQDS